MRLKEIPTGLLRAAQVLGVAVALQLRGKTSASSVEPTSARLRHVDSIERSEESLRGMCSIRKAWKWKGFLMALTARGARLVFPLLLLFALLVAAISAQAEDKFCSQYWVNGVQGVVDGNVLGTSPVQITIDMDCTFQNWPRINPFTATINFQTNDPSIYLIVFDNVWYDGNMACSNIDHKLWVVNSEEGSFSGSCQRVMIPTETIYKKSPGPTATIGLPFTYKLTIPAMNFPVGEDPSPNDLGNIHVKDDLTTTGAALTLVSLNACYKDTDPCVPVPIVNNGDNKHIDFTLPNLLKGQQIVVEMEVVLDDTPTNIPGVQFTNTATWEFSRSIDLDENGLIEDGTVDLDGDGTIEDEYFSPLPGEAGISAPMTIVAPVLVASKTSDATALNLGDTATFTIDVQNTGGGDAWNATVIDNIPVGMCDYNLITTTPLDVRIVQADGATLVKTLTPVTDYSVAYSGCQLTLTMIDDGDPISPEQHLIITYQTQLDPLSSPTSPIDGTELTNVAGATRWYSADSSRAGRREFVRSLTDGTPATIDHQDSVTVTAALHGYYFEKTVENLTSMSNPAATAAPGDTLRYKLRVFNVDQTINTITIDDQLDLTAFNPATFNMISINTGTTAYTATYNFDSSTGLLQIYGAPTLNVNVQGELEVVFDIALRTGLANGTTVSNQATLAAAGGFTARSDDPYINGVAAPDDPSDPSTLGDEDPTVVTIRVPGPPAKANPAPATATIGERFEYAITVPATAINVPLYDVQIIDALPSNLRFVSARVITGGAWNLSSSVTGTMCTIEDTVTGIDIAANGQASFGITVELLNSAPNQSSVFFNNSARYTYNRSNGVESTKLTSAVGTSPFMNVAEPLLSAAKIISFVSPAGKPAADPATVGDVIEYRVTIINSGGPYASTAFDVNIVDTLPTNIAPVPGSATATINGVAVTGFIAAPSTPSGTTLIWGRENGDGNLDIPAGQSLVLTYQVTVVDASSVSSFTNSAYVDWTSLDDDYPIDPVNNPSPGRERTGAGCPTTTLPNDYCAGPASITIYTADNTTIIKSVYADSYDETPPSTSDPILRVGDTVTYDLTLSLQEYTTRSIVVEDTLPDGMALQSFSIDADANFSYTPPPGGQPVPGATGTLRWEFGDVTNTPSSDNTPIDTIVIRYVAQVVTAAPPAGVGYATSILRDNQAKLSYTGGDPAVYSRLTTTERVEVLQPQMEAIRKADLGSGRIGTGSAADPFQVNIAADVMNFRLSSCNNGLAPAYNVRITDVLASQLNEASITTPVVAVGGTTLVAGMGYSYTPPAGRGGTMTFVLNTRVDPGQCVTVDYNIGFHTDFGPNQTWNNSATMNEYQSLAVDGRVYASTAAAQVWMTNQVAVQRLSKVLMSPSKATISEEVTYRITVPRVAIGAALDSVVVSDTLHNALEYVSATATLNGTGLVVTPTQTGQTLTWALGTIPAGQQVVITLTARVANNDQANAGTSFSNTASYTYTDIPAGSVTSGTSNPLTIIEPSVTVTKSVNAATPPSAGDILTYTVNVTAASGAGFSSVFDATLTDIMSLGLVYVSGSARVGGMPIEPGQNGGDGVTTAQTLTWSGIDIPEGNTVVITYDAQVLNTVAPGQTLSNSVTAQWTGLDGVNSNERTGSGTPVYNDYVTQPVILTLMARLAVSITKSVVNATTGENPGANAHPGDTLIYTLVVNNDSIVPVTGGSVVDELAAQFAPGSLQLVTVPAGADTAATNPAGGANGTGIVDVRNLTLGAQGDPAATQTIVFRATLAAVIPNGTVTLNQAQLSATNLTPTPSNQTSMLISSAPVFQVRKISQDVTGDSAVLMVGEVLRYTITVNNIGNENARNVVLRDAIPNNTTYVPDSTRLNSTVVPDATAGVSRLENGLLVNAPENTTPGVMRADADPATTTNIATITFDVRVNNGVANGTNISNQAFVNGAGDGGLTFPEKASDDPATPAVDDPTINTVTGLAFMKSVYNVTAAADGANAKPGDILRYRVEITNNGTVPLNNYSVIDDLQQLQSGDPLFVPGTLALISIPAGADTSHTDPQGGAKGAGLVDIRNVTVGAGLTVFFEFTVQLAPVITNATEVLNRAELAAAGVEVLTSNETKTLIASAPAWRIEKTVDHKEVYAGNPLRYTITVKNVGDENAVNVVLRDTVPANTTYVPNSTTLNGVPVSDAGGGASPLQDGTWKIYAPENSTPGEMRADTSDNAGNVATMTFDVTVNADVTDSTMISNQAFVNGTGASGVAFPEAASDDPATEDSGDATLTKVLQPNGIVYDSVRRTPLAGVTLTMRRVSTGADLPGTCFSDPAQQNQLTPANGTYKFDLKFDATDCPSGAEYLIAVTNVPDGYVEAASRIIPPNNDYDPVLNDWVSYSVPDCPADAVSSTLHCEAQNSTTLPARGALTTYYLRLTVDDDPMPEDSQIFNNHIPIDPKLEAAVAVTKTSPLINVTRGQLVPYTITLKNTLGGVISNLELIDILPPGFKYVEGSSRLDGTPLEPVNTGRQLQWGNLELIYDHQYILKLLMIVGSGVSEGKYVNRAHVRSNTINEQVSAEATATVRVVPDPTFDCTDVIGKVFDDRNLNGQQDAGERGLSGVRVVTARGLVAATDEHGRFHVTCAVVPDENRGSNFILKLDDRALPTGYRLTTENPRVQRATRGKMLRFNFGATIHHVVSMDIADGAFEPKSPELRIQWQPRIDLLLKELRKAPSVLRLSYLADVENEGLVEKRLKALKKEITRTWDGGYRLFIETEVFWRRGSPP